VVAEAIILAGGFGTRLQQMVSDRPKPLADVNGKPFLFYLVNYLIKFGVNKIVFATGYKHLMIEEYFNENKEFDNISFSFSVETTPLGTGGAIRKAAKYIQDDYFLVLNGDSFFNIDLFKFYQNYKDFQFPDVQLALRFVDDSSRYGAVEINQSNKIISFKEKSQISSSGYINAGVYLLKKQTFVSNTPEGNFSIENDFFKSFLSQIQMYGQVFNAYFIDIGIPSDYLKAQIEFTRFTY
jgi:D-glycero-alpha-D-manno-heptose 1-phosphate guanylyltransferase